MADETGKYDGQTDASVNLHPTANIEEAKGSDPNANINEQATTAALAQNAGTTNALAVADGNDDGWDELDANDQIVPFLSLLQDNSPQRKKKHEKYVEGAEEGMIFNSATGELYGADTGVTIVPVYVQKVTVEWEPRDEDGGGGGFVGRTPGWNHPDIVQQAAQGVPPNKYRSAAGNVLKQTYYLWCVICNEDGSFDYAIMSFESTKIAAFKDFNSKRAKATIQNADGTKTPVPAWRMLLNVGTRFQRGKKGDFYNYVLRFQNAQDGSVNEVAWKPAILAEDDPRAVAARNFYASIQSGAVVADTGVKDEEYEHSGPTSEDGTPF